MKSSLYRIINALAVALLAFKKPEAIRESNLAGLVALYDLIFKVAAEKRPYLSRIGFINVDTGEKHEFATI